MDVNILWHICQDLPISTIKNLGVTCKDCARSFNNELFWINLLKRDFGEHFSLGRRYPKDLYRDLHTKGAFFHMYMVDDLARGDVIKKLRCLTAFGRPLNIEVYSVRKRVSDKSVKRIPFSENTYCCRYVNQGCINGVGEKNSHVFYREDWIVAVHDG
jgi:hypothetical protein